MPQEALNKGRVISFLFAAAGPVGNNPSSMPHLLQELDNPAPSHKVRSEFLVTLCFAHLMAPEQVQRVLDSRIEDAEHNLRLIDEFESSCEEWPAGVKFLLA